MPFRNQDLFMNIKKVEDEFRSNRATTFSKVDFKNFPPSHLTGANSFNLLRKYSSWAVRSAASFAE